jgi:hypothetical protein
MDLLDFSDVETVVTALKAPAPGGAALRSVSTDPSKVNPPGVWVQVLSFEQDRLEGLALELAIVMVAPDQAIAQAMATLQQLWNKARPVLESFGGPSGPTQVVSVTLPNLAAPIPGLSVPMSLSTSP